MGLRFRRSVRLFPGVRLNFSRSGVSTSIGVRGATMTMGPRGTYANVGLPGSGLSYRTRLDAPDGRRRSATAPSPSGAGPAPRAAIHTAGAAAIPGTTVEIKSASVAALTSPGLSELKRLIVEATAHRDTLRQELAARKGALDRAAAGLRWAETPIIRLFTAASIPGRVAAANHADDAVDETQADLDGCFVEIDFPFDAATQASHGGLMRAFEALKAAQRIWDVTTTSAVDSVGQRTSARTALTRAPVTFDFAEPDIIRSQYRALRLGNVTGKELRIFPGFVMMRDGARDFALIEFPQFTCQMTASNFIEEGPVPFDAERIGSTWKRANKDGSRDRRFNDNYQIPIVRYAELAFSSPTGLSEVYQISSYAKAAAFAEALAAHQRALAQLNSGAAETLAPPAASGAATAAKADTDADAPGDAPDPAPRFKARPRTNLAVDWIALGLIVAAIGYGAVRMLGR